MRQNNRGRSDALSLPGLRDIDDDTKIEMTIVEAGDKAVVCLVENRKHTDTVGR